MTYSIGDIILTCFAALVAVYIILTGLTAVFMIYGMAAGAGASLVAALVVLKLAGCV